MIDEKKNKQRRACTRAYIGPGIMNQPGMEDKQQASKKSEKLMSSYNPLAPFSKSTIKGEQKVSYA